MPARRLRARAQAGIELSELLACMADAVLGAKSRLDQEAVTLAEQYKTSPVLRLLSPPSFAIGEVRFAIKYAVAQVERSASGQRGTPRPLHVYVHVAAASLGEMAPHLISEIELRIVPELKRPQATEEELHSTE